MNNSTWNPQAPKIELYQYITLGINICFMIVGTVGSGLMIAVIGTKKGRRSDNDIFLISLACADLLYIYIIDSLFIHRMFVMSLKSMFYCKFVLPMATVPFCAGIFTITSMAIQRCRVILNPWRPKTRIAWIYFWVFVIWLSAFLVILPSSIVLKPTGYHCYFFWPSIVYFRVNNSFLFAIEYPIPLLIITIAYARIGLYLSKPRVPRDSIVSKGGRRTSRVETRSESLQITKSLGVIVIIFAVFLLPVQVAWMSFTLADVNKLTEDHWVFNFWRYSDLIANAHSCLNPILYGLLTRRFRHKYREWFSRLISGIRQGNWKNTYQDRRVSPTYTLDSTMMERPDKRESESISNHVPNGKHYRLSNL